MSDTKRDIESKSDLILETNIEVFRVHKKYFDLSEKHKAYVLVELDKWVKLELDKLDPLVRGA